MGILEDILTALDRIPVWKRLQNIPKEMDDLHARVARLEDLASGKVPGAVCPYCGSPSFALERADMNGQREVWKCGACEKDRAYRLDLKQVPPRRGA